MRAPLFTSPYRGLVRTQICSVALGLLTRHGGGIWAVAKPQTRMQPLPTTDSQDDRARSLFTGALAILHSTEINAYICECALGQGSKEDSFLFSPGQAQNHFPSYCCTTTTHGIFHQGYIVAFSDKQVLLVYYRVRTKILG